MRFPFNPKGRAGIILLIPGLVALSYYLSTSKIRPHLSSGILTTLVVLFVLINFLVLPAYNVMVARELRKRRRAEESLVKSEKWFTTALASVGEAVMATYLRSHAESLFRKQNEWRVPLIKQLGRVVTSHALEKS